MSEPETIDQNLFIRIFCLRLSVKRPRTVASALLLIMRIHHLLLAACIPWVATDMYAQSPYVINDDLEVAGTLDVLGSSQTLGTLNGGSAASIQTLVETLVSSSPDVYKVNSFMDLNRTKSSFVWRELNTAGNSYQNILELDSTNGSISNNALTLYGPDASQTAHRITLVAGPSALSTIPGNLTVGDSSSYFQSLSPSNILPYQLLGSAHSIVTRVLGDARYQMRGDASLLYGTGSSAPTAGSIALGASSLASGTSTVPSVAIGTGAQAYTSTNTGIYNVRHGGIAIGNSARTGQAGIDGGGIAIGSMSYSASGAIAIGRGTIGNGSKSIAIGEDTKTYGSNSIAIGNNNITGGTASSLLGNWLNNHGMGTTVVGYKNLIRAGESQTTFQPNGYAFIVGNGISSPSDAFTIQWDGDAWLLGDFATGKSLSVAEDATIGGDVAVEGEIEASTARFSDTVRIEQRGGLSMGEFTYDPEAP